MLIYGNLFSHPSAVGAKVLFSFPFCSRRSSKPETNDELQAVERQVEKYRDVLQSISKKVSPANAISGQDPIARDKRMRKTHEWQLGLEMDESAKKLPDGLFKKILDYCGEWKAKRKKKKLFPIRNNELGEIRRWRHKF